MARIYKHTSSKKLQISARTGFIKYNILAKEYKNSGLIALQQPEIARKVVKLQPWFPEVFKEGKVKCTEKQKKNPQVSF